MFETATSQIILIGMASLCISFGAIYSLIFCYKTRRANASSEESQSLRDDLLRKNLIIRRKSTSLTSPPSADFLSQNPNYNVSPYKVPQRHLRSTSATYSPTHYLSPHHRRNSTPTHPHTSECTFCGCPRGCEQTKAVTSTAAVSLSHSSLKEGCSCEMLAELEAIKGSKLSEFLSTHKTRLIPVHPRKKKIQAECQKSFTFGPIPAARKIRCGINTTTISRLQEECATGADNKGSSPTVINFTLAKPLTAVFAAQGDRCTIAATAVPRKCKDAEEMDGKNKKETWLILENNENEKYDESAENEKKKSDCEIEKMKRNDGEKNALTKEHAVLEDIPFYVQQNCN